MNETLKCPIEEVFDANFIELLELVPANPHVRALILKFTGRMPPPECRLFDSVKDWVESNCVRRVRRTGEGAGITLNLNFVETESGRARYTVERYGSGTFSIPRGELLDLIEGTLAEGGSIHEVVGAITRRIDDDAWDECDPNWNDYGDYEYTDHDSTDSDRGQVKCPREDIRLAVLQFVRERHPELEADL